MSQIVTLLENKLTETKERIKNDKDKASGYLEDLSETFEYCMSKGVEIPKDLLSSVSDVLGDTLNAIGDIG